MAIDCGCSSVVERHLAKVNVARSNRVTRFQVKPLEILSSRGLMFLMVWQGNFAEFMVRKSSSFLALLPMLFLIPLLAFTHHFLGWSIELFGDSRCTPVNCYQYC